MAHLMASVFEMHDRTKFEVVGFCNRVHDGSEWRSRIEQGCDEFYEVSNMVSTVELAAFINSKGIDILFNLNGWTGGGRGDVFVLRPAPVQINYMGYCGSLGLDTVDYMITDKICSPPEHLKTCYTEKMIYMPHSYFVNDYMQSSQYCLLEDEKRPKREHYNLPTDKFIFGNFNQNYKIDPHSFTAWMNILRRVPNSVLWLLAYPEESKPNLLKEAARRGINPDRIIITPKAQKHEHINRCFLADLALDNPITNAHTTGCDTLWSGCPLLTCQGQDQMPSRVATSLLLSLECPELVTADLYDYEEKAVRLGTSPQELKKLREKIKEKRLTAPLFKTREWVKQAERGLLEAWRRYEAGQLPDHIDLANF